MNTSFLSLQRIACIMMMGLSSYAYCAKPILNINAQFLPPAHLKAGLSTAAIYQVTNNSKSLTTFKLQPIPGVTQITTGAGACSNPIVLNYQQSCT